MRFGDGPTFPVTSWAWTRPTPAALPEGTRLEMRNLADFHAEVAIPPETAARICRAVGLPQMADRIDIAAHPDLAELNVQIDGFYDEGWPV